MFYPPNYHKALKLQYTLFDECLKPETKPSDKAQLARAWDILEDRKRVILGKGLPKSVDTATTKGKRQKPGAVFDYGEAPIVAQDTTTSSVPSDKPSPEGHKSEQTPKTE